MFKTLYVCLSLWLSRIDICRGLLPNTPVCLLGVTGVLYAHLHGIPFHDSLSTMLFWGLGTLGLKGIVSVVLGKESLGWGDVKLIISLAPWMFHWPFGFFLFLSGLVGVVWGLYYQHILGRSSFPYGPALMTAGLVGFL